MKRKTTNLENKLITNGWYLESKDYIGKHSQKTYSYTYIKNIDYKGELLHCKVVLDSKRNKVLDTFIENMKQEYLSLTNLTFMHDLLSIVYEQVVGYEYDNKEIDDPNEIVETLEAIECE